jgi:hypothetical protein
MISRSEFCDFFRLSPYSACRVRICVWNLESVEILMSNFGACLSASANLLSVLMVSQAASYNNCGAKKYVLPPF